MFTTNIQRSAEVSFTVYPRTLTPLKFVAGTTYSHSQHFDLMGGRGNSHSLSGCAFYQIIEALILELNIE